MVSLEQTPQLLRCRDHRSLHKEPGLEGLEAGQAMAGFPGPGMIMRKYQELHQNTLLRASAPERMGTVPGSPGRLAATIQMAVPLAAPEI